MEESGNESKRENPSRYVTRSRGSNQTRTRNPHQKDRTSYYRKPNNQNSTARVNQNRPNRRPTYYFKTVCSQCKTATRVPFKPDGIRPVYCKSCFKKNRS